MSTGLLRKLLKRTPIGRRKCWSMTLLGPNKQDPGLTPQSLQSALDMDPSQPSQQTNTQSSRKRKKNDANGDEPAEPRRLRRSHEACARCRSKKIKASSLHASGDTDGNFQLACSTIDVQLLLIVRFEIPSLHGLCYCWYTMPSRGQASTNAYSARSHRAHHVPVETM